MKSALIALFALFTVASSADTAVPELRFVASFPFKKPAFVTAHRNPKNTSHYDLIISSFGINLFGKSPDGIYFIPNIGEAVASKSFQTQQLGQSVIWPNEVNLIDGRHLVVPGGFLVPGKKGHISLIDYDAYRDNETPGSPDSQWIELVSGDKGFFHRVEKINMLNKAAPEGDNGERFVTCRGYKGVFNQGGGEMVMLKPKPDGSHEAVDLAKGCDCFFAPVDLNKDGILEFIVPQFFGQKLSLFWTEHPQGDFTQPEYIRQRVIDEAVGAAFDLQVVDLDNDGWDEIIVTNHQNGKKGIRPSVFAYEMIHPTSHELELLAQEESSAGQLRFESDRNHNVSRFMENIVFHRHTLSEDFKVVNRAFMAAAPGGAQAVMPGSKSVTNYSHPVIIVSGDGSEKAYILTRDQNGDRWSYHHKIFHDCKGTVGGILVQDVDGDGWTDVFVPCYDTNEVFLYTFGPSN